MTDQFLEFRDSSEWFSAMSKAEIIDRLCALQETELRGVHQQWVDEALSSGPARPASPCDWNGALQRGLSCADERS